jgi:predicted porin
LISKLNIKLLLASMVMFSSSAEAVIVLQQASSSFDTQYDTNPLLREDKQSIWRYTITPRYSVAAVEDKNKWYANAALGLQRSSDKSVLQDREDPNVDIGWQRENEKGFFSLVAHYDKRSSRFSEFNRNGFVDIDGNAVTKSIAASWAHAITERLNFLLDTQYNKTTYDSSQFSDSITKSINSSLTYQFNERVSPFVQVGYTDFKSDGVITGSGLLIRNANNNDSSKSKNISVGAIIYLSPKWTFTPSVGVNKVDSANQNADAALGSASGSGRIGNFSLAYAAERANFKAVLSRSVSPSGVGDFVESDQFNMAYDYLLTEKSRVGAGYNINKNKSDFDSESTYISAWYSKELTEMWQMRLSIESRKQKSSDQNVDGNVIGLTFTYSTPEF